MIIELKAELERVANEVGANFTSKSNSELQDFVQGYNFTNPLINLKPIETYSQDIIASGAIRYDFRFELFFLTKFAKSDHLEDTKDILIDDMTQLSELFFTTLNKNENQYFINPSWKWTNGILRQYLSNLTCGIQASIFIDTSCNRVEDGFIPPTLPVDPPETFDELVALTGRGSAYPQTTGQTTIFRTNDDADVEANIFAPIRAANSLKAINTLSDFLTLNNNNSFGNTDRFTDVNGLQVYGDDQVIDNYTGLGWYINTSGTASTNWDDSIDAINASSQNGFNDWFMPNRNQLGSISNEDGTSFNTLNYSPFSTLVFLWGSTTQRNSGSAFLFKPLYDGTNGAGKTSAFSSIFYFLCRKHF